MLWLRSCIFQSDDIKKVSDWYEIALNSKPYFENENYIGFDIGGYELGIFRRESDYLQKWNTVEIYWGVEDAQWELDRLVWLGASPKDLPTDVGAGIIMASVIDPFGNFFGLIYNPNFK